MTASVSPPRTTAPSMKLGPSSAIRPATSGRNSTTLAGDDDAELDDHGPDVDIPRLDRGDRERPFIGGRGRRLGAGRAQIEKAHARDREQQRRQDELGESFMAS